MKMPNVKNFLSKIFKKKAEVPKAPSSARQRALLNNITLREDPSSGKIEVKNLALLGPDGLPLIDYGSFTLSPGDRMMLSGPAGCGKSAGLAAMRNAWLLGGSGEITVPREIRFVPQEDYFPDRSMRGIICAPDPESRYTQEQVVKALTDAGLADFIPEMDDAEKRGEYWKNTLSGGQKNKLGIAGIFLHAPDVKVLIVDEITAALDAKSEAALYPQIIERMKHGIVITVAHHASIAPHHNVFGTVVDGKVHYTDAPLPAPKAEEKPAATAQPPKPAA